MGVFRGRGLRRRRGIFVTTYFISVFPKNPCAVFIRRSDELGSWSLHISIFSTPANRLGGCRSAEELLAAVLLACGMPRVWEQPVGDSEQLAGPQSRPNFGRSPARHLRGWTTAQSLVPLGFHADF